MQFNSPSSLASYHSMKISILGALHRKIKQPGVGQDAEKEPRCARSFKVYFSRSCLSLVWYYNSSFIGCTKHIHKRLVRPWEAGKHISLDAMEMMVSRITPLPYPIGLFVNLEECQEFSIIKTSWKQQQLNHFYISQTTQSLVP